MLSLHNLEKSKSSSSKKDRRGRGNASGSGNYSGRGMKGQRSRSGGKSGLAARSIKGYLLRIPKVRGFKSLNKSKAGVNVGDLNKHFKDGERINARAMLKAGLISTIAYGVKILSKGELKKKLIVEANDFSASAREKITKAGGEAVVVGKKEKPVKKSDKKTDEKAEDKEETKEESKENK